MLAKQMEELKHLPAPTLPFELPSGRAKAVSIAIRYAEGKEGELKGTWADQESMCDLWKKYFGLSDADIVKLRDDGKHTDPTKDNIEKALKTLREDVRATDRLFVHFSGHGGMRTDYSGEEKDRKDETICPVDYKDPKYNQKKAEGHISDDELLKIFKDIPKGSSLLMLLDCCNSGTGLDLPCVAKVVETEGKTQVAMTATANNKSSWDVSLDAHLVLLSGSKDEQISKDHKEHNGMMTHALREVITKNPQVSYADLLIDMRSCIHNVFPNGQVPQLSSEKILDLDTMFLLGPKEKETAAVPQQLQGN